MAYTTGTISGPVDLITIIKDAAVAAGWTLNQFSTVGSGRRCHLNKGNCFVNLRAYVNETTNPEVYALGATQYSVIGHLSTSYNAANSWAQQPGNLNYNDGFGNIVRPSWGVTGLTTTATYHLFTVTSPDAIYCIVERSAGQFQWILFGNLDKNGDSWTGGPFYAAPGPWDNNNALFIHTVASTSFSQSGSANSPFAQVYVDGIDSFTGWATALNYSSNYPSSRLTDTFSDRRYIFDCAPNSFNSLAPLDPVEVFLSRRGSETVSTDATWATSFLGFMPSMYAVNMQSLIPGQEYTIGTDTFRMFPLTRISSTVSFNAPAYPGHSHYFGIAIKSN